MCYSVLPYFSRTQSKEFLHFLFLYENDPKPAHRFHILRRSFLKKGMRKVDTAVQVLGQWKEMIEGHEHRHWFEADIRELEVLLTAIENESKRSYDINLQDESLSHVFMFIARFLRKYMRLPVELPLFEAFYYSKSKELTERFSPVTQSVVRQALSSPALYFGEECAEWEFPDTSVAFHFLQEAGRQVNLHDWFHLFCSALDGRKESPEVLQARFMRTISELLLMGLIQPKNSNIVEKCIL